jgi:hypothetical protein
MSYLHHLFFPALLLGGLGTIAIFSLLFKENKLYRFFEHVYLGLATGYTLQVTWTDVLRPDWWDPMAKQGDWAWVLTVPLGLMIYGLYTRKFAWMARLVFGILFGLAAGTIFQAFSSEYVPQVASSFKPIIPHSNADIARSINNLIFIVILICVLVYFFFAFEQNSRFVRRTAVAGRWILMIALGAIFGSTIMTREALLIDRINFVVFQWLHFPRFGH